LNNASKQDALFNNPDAFYRTQGEDAIHASPSATKNLEQLRADLIDGLTNDYQRKRLSAALDAQMQLTRQQMARHVAEQSLAWQRQTAQDRIALLSKEAAYHHNDTDLVHWLGHAAATAARAHARVGDAAPGGPAEDAAAATARSAVLSSAIQTRLDKADTEGANALFTRVAGQLDLAHAAPLQKQIEAIQSGASLQSDEPIDIEATPDNPERPKPWEELGLGERLATVFRRFVLEGEARGAAFGVDSAGRRLQQVDELTKRKAAGEQLNVTEERFLLKNRNAPSELVGSVGRLVDAQKRIGELPRSAALGRLLEAPTFNEALQIARKNPGEIAAALGLESAPDALMGLAALAALGPVAGGAVLTGTAGAQGYASGLIGALSMEGVDLTDREQLKRALRDNELMQRVRARAGTQAAIEAGTTLTMAMIGGKAGKIRAGSKGKVPKAPLKAYKAAFDARRNKNIYEGFLDVRITGWTRGTHRRQANRYLEKLLVEHPDFAKSLNRELNTDVLAHMRSTYWRRTPPGMTWHHPFEKKAAKIVRLMRVEEHTNKALQKKLHPGGRGGFSRNYISQINPRRVYRRRQKAEVSDQ
jgi:hypothetical protein